ncbi:hypothetical protein CEXT_781421 [Caerostris extrusa]|uniref:Uncharacterized protein n=1 Tax=Caerostris extrusa TaxID=172846 RepID=A0AAV4SPV6_CAEEX|nr:hypothetical protein CEXT_781421 [Caerostris extrusa]
MQLQMIFCMSLNGDQRSAQDIVEAYNWFLISEEKELEKYCNEIITTYEKNCKKICKIWEAKGYDNHADCFKSKSQQ